MFTISLEDLSTHAFAVNKCAWNSLWRNPGALSRLEEEAENAISAADYSCLVILAPQAQNSAIGVYYRYSTTRSRLKPS